MPDDDQDEPNGAIDPNDPPDQVDPSRPIRIPTALPSVPFGLKTPPMPTAEARDVLVQYLYDLADAGQTLVRATDFGDVIAETGLSGDWVRKELRRLSEGPDAILRKTDRGVWRLPAAQPA